MVSKILSVAALAGVAMASCPLSVEIAGTHANTVQVAVTNTGKEAITVFKGNTVLMSEHDTKDLLVSDASGKALTFQGIAVQYIATDVPASMFQTFQPGEKFTASVNAAKTHNLAGLSLAKISALQGFKYVTGATAPTTLSGLQSCEASSKTVSIVPNQAKALADKIVVKRTETSSRIKKRAVTIDGSCSGDQVDSLNAAVNDAISMAGAARDNAGPGTFDYNTWFIDNSQVGTVQGRYSSVTTVGDNPAPQIQCTDSTGNSGGCPDGTIAYTYVNGDGSGGSGPIIPCPAFFENPELTGDCTGYDQAAVMLHEMTHLFGTQDITYGYDGCKGLSATDAANNADTYRYYAQSVRLGGCA